MTVEKFSGENNEKKEGEREYRKAEGVPNKHDYIVHETGHTSPVDPESDVVKRGFHKKLLALIGRKKEGATQTKSEVSPQTTVQNNESYNIADGDTIAQRKSLMTNVLDFLPVVGSLKMVAEGFRGKQYGTDKELHGKERFIHVASGLLFCALDVTGVGAIASEIGKAGFKLSLRAIEKEAVAKVIENKVVREEAGKLASRGEERMEK